MNGESLSGKTALVTGGAVRLGRATARALSAEGAWVVIHYSRSEAAALELAEELAATGGKAWTLRADFESADDIASLLPRAQELAGGLDALVNNASIFPAGRLAEVSWGDLARNMHVNAWAPFSLSRSFAEQVGGGSVVNFLDTRIRGYDWNHVAYIVSKHALELLTRMMALEFAPEVRVNAVAPGLILPPPGKDESYLEEMKHTVPLNRHGEAEDVAAAAIFLLQSTYITGQIIYVDGGRHLLEQRNGPNPG